MLLILLIGAAISAVRCETDCPQFNALTNNPSLLNSLTGSFYAVYESTTPVIDCQIVSYYVINGELIGITQYPGCCMEVFDFDTSDPTQVNYQITNLTAGCSTSSTVSISSKFIQSLGSGDDLCMVYSSCRETRQGVYIICRQRTFPTSLIGLLEQLLLGLLLGLGGVSSLQPVNQGGCVFPQDNCPAPPYSY